MGKIDENTLKRMKLHQVLDIPSIGFSQDPHLQITKVIGGWLYRQTDSHTLEKITTFVPEKS